MTMPNRSPRRHLPEFAAVLALMGSITATPAADLAALREQVRQTECAFAASMARRDLAAFERHLSPQTVFSGGKGVLRGPAAVVAAWRGFFEGAEAPFSWVPDEVEVLEDGSLARSSGPVFNPKGELISRFDSVWRLESPGVWRIVFDKGGPLKKTETPADAALCNR